MLWLRRTGAAALAVLTWVVAGDWAAIGPATCRSAQHVWVDVCQRPTYLTRFPNVSDGKLFARPRPEQYVTALLDQVEGWAKGANDGEAFI